MSGLRTVCYLPSPVASKHLQFAVSKECGCFPAVALASLACSFNFPEQLVLCCASGWLQRAWMEYSIILPKTWQTSIETLKWDLPAAAQPSFPRDSGNWHARPELVATVGCSLLSNTFAIESSCTPLSVMFSKVTPLMQGMG